MTVVNTDTGEIVEFDVASAKRLTERIRLLADSVADGVDRLVDLINQARVHQCHVALGYRSWTEYVEQEFRDVLPRLGREPRQEFVRQLADMGMSTRAIAPLVGMSKSQVADDLSSSGHVAEHPIAGRDGKSYAVPSARPDDFDWKAFNEAAEESGWAQKKRDQDPYVMALIKLTRAAEAVGEVTMTPAEVASNVPDISLHRIDAIRSTRDWLDAFIAAYEESQ